MATFFHFPARRDVPIACDLTTASDTPAERLAAYRALFATALIRRRRDERGLTLVFRAHARARVEDPRDARRRAARSSTRAPRSPATS